MGLFETQAVYKSAPLPFMGQKRNFLKKIKAVLSEKKIDKDTVFIDVFGGSGLIAHNVKTWYEDNEVIWNDFDNYQKRLDNIENTKEIARAIIDRCGDDRIASKKLDGKMEKKIKDIIAEFTNKYGGGGIDFLTINSWFCFSGKYPKNIQKLLKSGFYRKQVNLNIGCEGYLKGVVRERLDFRDLLKKYQDKKAFLILDPPYLNTQSDGYKNGFSLRDMVYLLKEAKDKDFIIFSAKRSELDVLLEILGIKKQVLSASLSVGDGKNGDLMFY